MKLWDGLTYCKAQLQKYSVLVYSFSDEETKIYHRMHSIVMQINVLNNSTSVLRVTPAYLYKSILYLWNFIILKLQMVLVCGECIGLLSKEKDLSNADIILAFHRVCIWLKVNEYVHYNVCVIPQHGQLSIICNRNKLMKWWLKLENSIRFVKQKSHKSLCS